MMMTWQQAIAFAAFCLGVAHCGAAEKTMTAERYRACIYATHSVQDCGRP